jgi:hypothetical protein
MNRTDAWGRGLTGCRFKRYILSVRSVHFLNWKCTVSFFEGYLKKFTWNKLGLSKIRQELLIFCTFSVVSFCINSNGKFFGIIKKKKSPLCMFLGQPSFKCCVRLNQYPLAIGTESMYFVHSGKRKYSWDFFTRYQKPLQIVQQAYIYRGLPKVTLYPDYISRGLPQ